MTDQSAAEVTGTAPAGSAHLEPDAIGVAQDTMIGMANSAPAVSTGLTLAALAAATAYAVGPIILITAIPMLIIANGYRRLNLWNANCGASFEWVGRAINPYSGFVTGWLMVAGRLIGTISGVVVLAPRSWPSSARLHQHVAEHPDLHGRRPDHARDRDPRHPPHRTHPGRHGPDPGWLRDSGPGRAAILAVVFLAIIFTVSEVGLQGVVSPARLQANSDSALVSVARAIGGGGWEKVMALALALSVIASTGTGIAVSLIVIAIMWVYLLPSSVANVFTDLIDVTGLLYIGFYILTAVAAMAYYRSRVFSNAWDG